MAKDHFIPASLMARFSQDAVGPARKRKVWSLRSNGSRAEVRAEAVGYSNGLYDVDSGMFPTRGVRAVDDVWSSYEGDLPGVLDRLIDRSVTAAEWIDTLVPFVAASFARDRGYKSRVTRRLANSTSGLFAEIPELAELALDDTNIAINRLMEMERFAARALASEWVVFEFDEDIVLPDVGYGFDLVSEDPDVLALWFPIGRRNLLMLTPCASRRVITRSEGEWKPSIYYSQTEVKVGELNRALAHTAQDFIVGTRTSIDDVRPEDLGRFDWHAIDEVLEQWPFSVDTRELGGLHRVVQAVVHGELESFDGVSLDRYGAVSELEPGGTFMAPNREIRAERFLAFDGIGLVLSVD
ncbi:DUF4238 domain-containing protein [Paenarthrobacter sp. MSM-2-10-13]|uniref:DUF4238 domain-containing protein n=1 Tax=Paenarthrobacter sp. MSM-2-10-13 TaxID=2717318 RepID=UPI0014217D20|nr:DUF4238 domain-containing protein [Paenarthrobacter sp. MSM-2-10-13]NHW49341.1 DUF4238 domain-containing protein [Paenarthrobacter sp. MSM-2-10-13]